MTPSDWIALASAVATAATPLAVVAVGHWLNKRFKSVEESIERNRALTATKFDLYRDIGFQLNDLYAYFNFIGFWKDLTPSDVIERKRHLDRHMCTFQPVLGERLFLSYISLSKAMFKMYPAWGQDARLRTISNHRAEHGVEKWQPCFTQENNLAEINAGYNELMHCLASDLKVELVKNDPRPAESYRRRDSVD